MERLNIYTATDADVVNEFFAGLKRHILLSKQDRDAIVKDFEHALRYYISVGIPLSEAFSRLDPANLGEFYALPPRLWFALDNAAIIYPLAMRHGYMAVFRMSVYLKETVVPEILQMALTFTIKRFPSFATTVKKGFFWHYLNATKRRYTIEPDTGTPCRPLKVSGSGSQSFRVLYYDSRISVEFFHVLTDGTGGMVFLKTLTAEYFRLLGVKSQPGYGILPINGSATVSETANEFSRAEKTDGRTGLDNKLAAQFSGKLSAQRPCRILHFKMDADKLKATAKSKNATITSYILALMFVAGKEATYKDGGAFNIQVPVNMRKYYPSDTVRNFVMYCGVRLPVAEITDVSSMIPEIARQLDAKGSKRVTSEMMNSTERMVSALRYIPLFIKAPVARFIYGFLGDKVFTSILSNLGVVAMPPELVEKIDSMDFALGTTLTNRARCAMITFNNTVTLSITKATKDPSFEEEMYRLLLSDGIEVSVEGSE